MTIDEFNARYPVRRILPDTCWCGDVAGRADDHLCGECPEHCELQAHREERPSPRDVELRRLRAAGYAVGIGPAERRSA